MILAHLPPPVLLKRNEEPSLEKHRKKAMFAYTFAVPTQIYFVLSLAQLWFSENMTNGCVLRLKQGLYRSLKTWKIMEFIISISRPGKSWNLR